jgi:hypothetical protein
MGVSGKLHKNINKKNPKHWLIKYREIYVLNVKIQPKQMREQNPFDK